MTERMFWRFIVIMIVGVSAIIGLSTLAYEIVQKRHGKPAPAVQTPESNKNAENRL